MARACVMVLVVVLMLVVVLLVLVVVVLLLVGVAWLPPGPASLAVLSYFYAGASELDRAA